MARAAALAALCLVFAMAVTMAGRASALPAGCDVGKLAVCGPAIIGGAPPSRECCTNLKAQQGCLCAYAHDPKNAPYVNSPNARKTLSSCGIPIPSCAGEVVTPAIGV